MHPLADQHEMPESSTRKAAATFPAFHFFPFHLTAYECQVYRRWPSAELPTAMHRFADQQDTLSSQPSSPRKFGIFCTVQPSGAAKAEEAMPVKTAHTETRVPLLDTSVSSRLAYLYVPSGSASLRSVPAGHSRIALEGYFLRQEVGYRTS